MKTIHKILIGIVIISIGLGIIANKMIEDKKNAEIEAEKLKLKLQHDEDVRLQTEKNKIFDTAYKLNDECNVAIYATNAQRNNTIKIASSDNYNLLITKATTERTVCNRVLTYLKANQAVLDSGNTPYWATDAILRIENNQVIDTKTIDWANLALSLKRVK